jgi:hypothetical protein
MASKYRDKYGPIPDDHFENEPGPQRPLESTMSPEALAVHNAHVERMQREIAAERDRRRKKKPAA